MDLIIKNGTIVTATEMFKADVAVKDGKIAAIGADLPTDGCANVVDATGKLVLPGAIDAHTHLAMPFGGTISADGYFAGTRAAACGGTTTVFDYVLQDFDENMVDSVKRRDALCAPEAAVDYAFHVGVKDVHGDLLDSMKEAVDFGVPSFKVFMVYDFGVKDGVFYEVLKKSKEIGALINVHAENNEMVNMLTEKYISEGKGSAWYHYMSRPEFVEAEADSRAIAWAKSLNAPLYIVHLANKDGVEYVSKAKEEGYSIYAETCPEADSRAIAWAKSLNAPLYIVHLANKDGVEYVSKAKEEGYSIYAETCPQYLEFTCDVFKREDGRNFVCSPPMKGQESQDASALPR